MKRWMYVAVSAVVVAQFGIADARAQDASQDLITAARDLATSGRRPEAIRRLRARLAASPTDSDARVLLAAVLSWDGNYEEARTELAQVFKESPNRGDALAVLVNVELWSDHPDRAETLTRQALRRRPKDPELLFGHARALNALNRVPEARDVLDRLLLVDPRHVDGRRLRDRVGENLRRWSAGVSTSVDWFNDNRLAWQETSLSLKRRTNVGTVILRASQAHRFGSRDQIFEIEAYPSIRPGTYLELGAGWAPMAELYPVRRFMGDLYQSLGGGFQASIGMRRLDFDDPVHIYVGTLTKYYSDWAFTGRLFLTPNSIGTSRSYHVSTRRYFGDGTQYIGARVSQGSTREEIRGLNDTQLLNSHGAYGEASFLVSRRVGFDVRAGFSEDERIERVSLRQYTMSANFSVKF